MARALGQPFAGKGLREKIMEHLQFRPVCRSCSVLDCVPFGQCKDWPEFFRLRLELPDWDGWLPGQFVMLRPESWSVELSWARPFSICSTDDAALDIFFQVVGRGTSKLTELERGDRVVLWGPLGRGFATEPETPTLLLAGGIGISPFVGYALRHPDPDMLRLVFGHRPPVECYPFSQLGEQIRVENLREQEPGDLERFIELMHRRMREYVGHGLVLACGPTPFLRTVHKLALETGARTQLSLENRMACGMGVCMGCVTPVKDKELSPLGLPLQVCTAGPVFWAEELEFES